MRRDVYVSVWKLNPRPQVCQASTLPVSHILSPFNNTPFIASWTHYKKLIFQLQPQMYQALWFLLTLLPVPFRQVSPIVDPQM